MNTGLQSERLLKPDRYQVFLLSCPASIPVNFFPHPWFVVNKKGAVSRWEIFWQPGKCPTSWKHLHKDFCPPFQGTAIFFFTERYLWKNVKMLGVVEGGEGSLVHHMADFIERSPEQYPYCNKYSLMGPNSNTYAEWVLSRFPQCGLRLPWNSYGKAYKVGLN